MERGVEILGQVTKPCKLKRINENTYSIILTQGLNRQIRRMSKVFGFNVVKLERIRILNITLKDIEYGKWRYINREEIEILKTYKLIKGIKMENNKVKVWFLKLVVSFGSVLIIYTIASDLYKIAYLEFKGVETTGKLITFNEKINSGKFKSKSYTPVVRIKVYGQEIDVPAKLNKIDKDLVDFVGDEVKVKYSSKDYNLLIINDKNIF